MISMSKWLFNCYWWCCRKPETASTHVCIANDSWRTVQELKLFTIIFIWLVVFFLNPVIVDQYFRVIFIEILILLLLIPFQLMISLSVWTMTTWCFDLYILTYIHIYMYKYVHACVCVCVCVWLIIFLIMKNFR